MSDYDQSMSVEQDEHHEEVGISLDDLGAIFKPNQRIKSLSQLHENVQETYAKLKKIQKKHGGQLKLLDVLEAINNSFIVESKDSQMFVQFLSNWQVLKKIVNDWNDIRHSKLLGLVLHMFDRVLSIISKSQSEDYFESIAILYLQEQVSLSSFFSLEQFSVGLVELLNTLSSVYYKEMSKFQNDEKYDIVEHVDDNKKRGSLFDDFLKAIESLSKSKLVSSNFDLIFNGFLHNLNLIKKPPLRLKNLIYQIQDNIDLSQWKTSLTIIPDLPIIKVRPLTPRIKDEFLYGFKKKLPDTQDLKRKQKMMKKILIKEIRDDQQYVNQMKSDTDQLKKEGNKQAFKKFSRIMDDTQMEYKKLKTTQLNIKRIKKKSKRMGGKHQ